MEFTYTIALMYGLQFKDINYLIYRLCHVA